jgi:hypothetical protein
MEWWIDAAIGTVSAGPKILPQVVPYEGRRMIMFSSYISRSIPPGGHLPVWDIELKNAKRPGIYPIRLVFRSAQRIITYPAQGLDVQGMNLEIAGERKQSTWLRQLTKYLSLATLSIG